MNTDTWYMQQALQEAQKAYDCDEVPIGAVVIDAQGQIIGRGYNQVQSFCSQQAHAECRAIGEAGHLLQDWRLIECTLFVTLEPCGMCMELIYLSRIKRVVFGASSPLFGYRLDKAGQVQLYKRDIICVDGNILERESAHLLKQFFSKKRKEKSDWGKKES